MFKKNCQNVVLKVKIVVFAEKVSVDKVKKVF